MIVYFQFYFTIRFVLLQTLITCPLTYEDKSDARNRHTLATSSGSPPRLSGIFSYQPLTISSGSCPVMSVMINPGATALQRILRTPSSLAIDFVN